MARIVISDALHRCEKEAMKMRKMDIIWADLGDARSSDAESAWIMSHVIGTGHEPMFDRMMCELS